MQKSVYYTLNLFTFDAIGKFFIAECWVPSADLENVRLALEEGVVSDFNYMRTTNFHTCIFGIFFVAKRKSYNGARF